jgi:hypothetical protein
LPPTAKKKAQHGTPETDLFENVGLQLMINPPTHRPSLLSVTTRTVEFGHMEIK